MGCNCKKNSGSKVSSPVRASVTPKGRGVNNGKSVSKVKRVMRRQFK
jgi:hypothetical protein